MSELKKDATEKAAWDRVQDLGRGAKGVGRKMWLAGLGTVEAVDETGRGLFSDLVSRGRRFAERERPVMKNRFRRVGDRIDTFRHRVEHGVESRVGNTLKRFGVPDRDEVQQLIGRIEQLTRKVENLAKARS